jgi:hypothetical protein
MAEFIDPLAELNSEWGDITMKVGERAMVSADEIGAASVDYTLYSGYVSLAYMWAQMAGIALAKLEVGGADTAFYQAKLATARFYFKRILPRTRAHAAAALAGADTVMQLDQDAFAF